jgi:outer membrane protein assembly factor BamB
VAADGKIYAAGRNGFVVVLEDGPKVKVLANNDMAGEIIATPAIADGRLYIRTREKLYCITEKGAAR